MFDGNKTAAMRDAAVVVIWELIMAVVLKWLAIV